MSIHARRVDFDWAEVPIHWIPGEPMATHVTNVLHLLLPAGERWFCHVYAEALPLVRDPQLREDVRGFIGQEAVHARAHQAVLDHLEAHGLDTTAYTKRIEWMFNDLLGDYPRLMRRLPKRMQRQWLIRRLAIIAAVEHFTCVMGDWVIDSPGYENAGADPTMVDLLRWHGAEEVEHRSVAFDVFTEVSGGSYLSRALGMLTTFPALLICWYLGTRYLVRNDPSWPEGAPASYREAVRAGKRGFIPPPRVLYGAVPRYLKRDYHPSKESSTERALAYLATSPAAREYATG